MKKIGALLILLGLLHFPATIFGQTEPEDVALESDEFQNYFYESLKQKGMENYDKAVQSLEQCLRLQPKNPVLFSELGKNYLSQRRYKEAYDNFEKASQLDPTNRWYLVGMYDVCYETRDFVQAIVIVQKLVEFKKEYKEDLVSLYMNTQQFDKALDLINELNATVGKSEKRELYKADILQDARYQGAERNNLLEQIRKNPKEESNYVALIYMYSQSNQEEKALEIAKKLETEIPTSDWAQVSLFKFHINNNDGEKAIKAMNIVLASTKIDRKIKHRIFNEFLIFTKNDPKYAADLDKTIRYFADDKEVKVAKELGKFYANKKDWDTAIKYYEMHLKSAADDYEAAILLLQAFTEKAQFDKVVKTSEEWAQLFPSQPQFYYFAGLGYNQLKNFKKAKDNLEYGLDNLVDDPSLEIDLYLQLVEAYNGLGDAKKKDVYFIKANELLKKQKK